MKVVPMSLTRTITTLRYIAASPKHEHGGFHPQAVDAAKSALFYIRQFKRNAKP